MTTGARKQPRRLGKGLESLMAKPIEIAPPPAAADVAPQADPPADGLVHLPTDRIAPNPRQPRQTFDEASLATLAASIESAGMMQPVVVRAAADGYELVAGERRWRAAQAAGLTTIPALVRDIDDRTAAEWALIENLQREDLNPVERAEAFQRLSADFGATQQEIADRVGIDRSSVANFLRLNELHDAIKDEVRTGRLTMGHAKVLLGIPDESTMRAIARRCAKGQWSVRELERRVARTKASDGTSPATEIDPVAVHLSNLATRLESHLGTKVHITPGRKAGTGRLVLEFFDNDQFEGLLERLGMPRDP